MGCHGQEFGSALNRTGENQLGGGLAGKSAQGMVAYVTRDVESHNIDQDQKLETMALNLHITIPENSPAAQVVQHVAATEHITPEQAVTRILTEAANRKPSPAKRMIGLFSSPEDAALMDEVMQLTMESRQSHTTRDIGL